MRCFALRLGFLLFRASFRLQNARVLVGHTRDAKVGPAAFALASPFEYCVVSGVVSLLAYSHINSGQEEAQPLQCRQLGLETKSLPVNSPTGSLPPKR